MRDLAVNALSGRYGVLLERSKQRQLTQVERSEVDRLELAINTLQSMGCA
jgi:hypothetical protein